ncbi:MAG: AAA family ATPase [Chloroflexi bacterium]|nr:AAA family ATPase [Chloroflexota bacterium]
MDERRGALEVAVEDLTARCDPDDLPFASTEELHALEAVFGQERAVRAIEFALGMQAPGYNLYASGPDGIGKASIIETLLRRRAETEPAPPDHVYVHNFEDPDRPVGIELPAGEAAGFASQVRLTVERAIEDVREAFESDAYVRQRADVGGGSEQRRGELIQALQRRAAEMGFALQMTPQGVMSSPLINGQPASDEEFNALPQEQRDESMRRAREELEPTVQDTLLQVRGLEREARDALVRLDEAVAAEAIEERFAPLRGRYPEHDAVTAFLDAVQADIVRERDRLRAPAQGQRPAVADADQPRQALLRRYAVNALVTNDANAGAPVIVETNPTYQNLLGRIEYVGQAGMVVTDHTMIRTGSLGQANGGDLMLRMRDPLANGAASDGLKRALHSAELTIESLQQALGLIPTAGLRPEPTPLHVKVVIIGDASMYPYLYRLDPDFRELFRVKADFEVDFERNRENILGLSSVIHGQCDREGMACFSDRAVARLIEHSSRLVEDQRRLSGNMGALLDLVRQADYWAGQDGSGVAHLHHVERALEEGEYRSSLVRDRMQQLIDEGTVFIDTEGEQVGQINALSVYNLGDITFGRPSRITCVVSAGRGTIVNIERESDMAGRTHNKGFLILRGLLADRFGQDMAMALHASLTFEQLYNDIDGDSASSTELYALLSALAEAPIRQSIAVTGSLNQRGDVQPIGGATAKIEGFFEVCRARGLDGTQGVMIPASNVPSVVLRPEVAEAVERGEFHVWAIERVEQGIEVLTGIPAGEPDEDGAYPPDTIFGGVQARLRRFAEALRGGAPPGVDIALVPSPRVAVPPQPGVPPQPPPEPPVEV